MTPRQAEAWIFRIGCLTVLIIWASAIISAAHSFWPGLLGSAGLITVYALHASWYDKHRPTKQRRPDERK